MKTVSVSASRPYSVQIGAGILPELGERLRAVSGAQRVALVSDENVYPLYGESVRESLARAGFSVVTHLLPAGETHKTLDSYAALLSFFAENRLDRSDLALALGGGTVGDLTGFAAATYRRGIDYVQLPTTLLAAVDASVGGKTGVDLPQGKNLVGAFHQPCLVLCDTETLATLPETEFRSGCAEIIKYALLGDGDFFTLLEQTDIRAALPEIIARCVERKAELVARDEFDRGERKKLNLGHTVGHAIELCSGYTVPHGFAVGMGMAAVCRMAEGRGYCEKGTAARVIRLLEKNGLPTALPYAAEELYTAALSDKKTEGERISLIVPTGVGRCEVISLPLPELREWLREGGAK